MKNAINISMRSRIFIWANSDLDGAGSVILLGKIFPEFDYQSVFFGKFEETYTSWAKNNLENYDKVFIVGMVLDQTLINKIDDPRLVVVSDRGDKLTSFDSLIITEEYSSCCKLLYKKFKEKIEFPIGVKMLVAYIDDYNNYVLKYEESRYLNALYRTMGYRSFYKFVERFSDGFDGFTESEVASANTFFDKIANEMDQLVMFTGEFRGWKVISTFTKCSVNEIAKEIIDNYPTDVIIIVNPDTKFVSFRKPVGSEANIKYMAENLCGGGGGEWVSGGHITQKFLEFTTKLVEL